MRRLVVLASPEMVLRLAGPSATVTVLLSGLGQVLVTVAVPSCCKVVGLADQDICCGFFGGSFTEKLAVQLAILFFLAFASVTVAVAV